MSYGSGWDVWTPEEEALYREFAAFHVAGTPWPIQQMNLATITRRLNCRPFTQQFLKHKAFMEWKKEQAEKVEKEKERGYIEWRKGQAEKEKKEKEDTRNEALFKK